MEDSFTFDDVLLLPGHSKVLPAEVSVKAELPKLEGHSLLGVWFV